MADLVAFVTSALQMIPSTHIVLKVMQILLSVSLCNTIQEALELSHFTVQATVSSKLHHVHNIKNPFVGIQVNIVVLVEAMLERSVTYTASLQI